MKRRPKKERSAAALTLRDADRYSKAGAHSIAEWLRRLANDVENAPLRKQLSGTFRARFICTES